MLPSLLKINMQLAKLGQWYQMRLKKVGGGPCFVRHSGWRRSQAVLGSKCAGVGGNLDSHAEQPRAG